MSLLLTLGADVKHIWTDPPTPKRIDANKRGAARRVVALPARLTWKDQRGTTRFATVIARNVSDFGVYVECASPVSIPLFRLVQFQLERDGRDSDMIPDTLQQGRVLSAVYRVSPPSGSQPQGLALRLMVDPRRHAVQEETRASA
ncbi:MAG: hypothetical protein JWL71_3496 [Acidobacteria bacterium]|nr:hypothetical protein [Acidobacteriota bacterium]